ncbi:response regulator [Lacinutrix sp. 5H-3-7-4]|uniref:response regulator n=1 Tax=Lacinutrix sp. (strain 5H-3-7-4) TaxID=983544 RepID=UPI00020A33BA|nr:response regulator [Lacinutrix sp. 5H-3-7-4]AEH00669.1 response regulator receiver [Lacinutrix sp. 5H-3-7-4]
MNSPVVELACIIDDDNVYVNLVKKIIETKKLCENLIVFSDGKQSIDYFEALLQNLDPTNIPEIIFLDLNMPIMDGWEFLERFTKIKNRLDKAITLYVVSSSINPLDVNRAKALSSVKDYLIKPVNIDELENIFSAKV